MKIIRQIVCVAMVAAPAMQPAAAQAAVVEYELAWTGGTGGYTGLGTFSFDDSSAADDDLITGDELLSLSVSIFDGLSNVTNVFTLAGLNSSTSSFNFVTSTETLLTSTTFSGSFPSSTNLLLHDVSSYASFASASFCGDFVVYSSNSDCYNVPHYSTGGTIATTLVTPAPVPLPTSIWLLAAGAGALGLARRRRRAA